ncbi:MAG TPA: hypothetical protein VM433_00290 [Mycobacteriales bacterium]|nr:hypothetical protein [Mycobacteriales bacterium]
MTPVVLAHGEGVSAYDELILVGVLLLVLLLAVLQLRWSARQRAQDAAEADPTPDR